MTSGYQHLYLYGESNNYVEFEVEKEKMALLVIIHFSRI